MTDTLSIPVAGGVSGVSRLGDVLSRFCDEHGIAPEVGAQVKLAIEEIVVNVIRHGYGQAPDRVVEVRVAFAAGTFTATVADDAEPFDPLQAAAPDLTAPLGDRRVGGLGIHLVRQLMDDVVYRREGSRNIVVMTKRVAARGAHERK